MSQPNSPSQTYQLETDTRFSESVIWQIQQEYYDGQGVNAWKFNSVPHYVTTNPVIAHTYAKIALGFFRDRQRIAPSATNNPLYFVELGAGSGRFAFYFLKMFTDLYQRVGFTSPHFCYILTDLSEHNVTFWQNHPRFQPFIEQGIVDFAQYDATADSPLQLTVSGKTLRHNSTQQPIIVIGNYFFDSIRQDLFRVQDGQLYECRTSVTSEENPDDTTILDRIWKLDVTYSYRQVRLPFYNIPLLDDMLAHYQTSLIDAHVYIPHIGVQCLQHLNQLTTAGLLLLCGDKGRYTLEQLEGTTAPKLVRHGGAFSLNVNFHALEQYFQQRDGLACFPDHTNHVLNITAFLGVPDAAAYHETKLAYHEQVNTFGNDEFYALKQNFLRSHKLLPIKHLIVHFRLSRFDPQFIMDTRYHLQRILSGTTEQERAEFFIVLQRAWELYYHISEPEDIAFDMAMMLYEMDYVETAALMFRHSLHLYGTNPSTLYNLAACYRQMGAENQMQMVTDHLLALSPAYAEQVAALAATE